MLPEALVIFACLSGSGCTETSGLYFSQNPEVKRMVDEDAQEVERVIGPKFVDTVGPFLFLAAGGNGMFKIDKNFSVNVNRGGSILFFRLDL